jgi:hypothetical protein
LFYVHSAIDTAMTAFLEEIMELVQVVQVAGDRVIRNGFLADQIVFK